MHYLNPEDQTQPRQRLKAIVTACVLAWSATALPALAQQAGAALNAERVYSLPAQALGQALNDLARQAGVAITVDARLVAGKREPAVAGRMTAGQALERMLQGSGLVGRQQGATLLVVQPPPAPTASTAPEITLPAVTVSGEQEKATGPVDGYVASRTASGTKTDTRLREIPQSITVVGREQVQEQGARTIQESMRYASSVVADLFGLDTRNDGIAIRGQEASVKFLDGMRRFYGNYVNSPPADPYSLERIEILRGPSSLLYGQSGVGGTINMVSKRPQSKFGGEVGVGLGSHDAKELTLDITGPATDDGRWLYRLVALNRDANSQVDHVSRDRQFIAPSLTWLPSRDTSVTLLAHWSKDRSGSSVQFLPHEGTLFPGPNGLIPVNRFVGEPDLDRYDADTLSAALLIDHKLNDTWSLRQGLRYQDVDVTYAQLFPYLPNRNNPFTDPQRRTVGRDLSYSFNNTRTVTWDGNAVGQFAWGLTQHKVLIGLDHSRARHNRTRDTGVTDCNTFDLYNPVYGGFAPCDFSLVPLGEIPFEARPDRVQSQSGLYVQDQVRMGKWIAVLGLRKDWTRITTQGSPAEKAEALTHRAGLMYEHASGATPYLSYAESFVPLSGSDFFDRPFQPLRGRSVEAGVKYQPAGSSLNIEGAIFSATENNRLAADPDHPGFSVQSAEVRLQGLEVEARGDLTSNTRLIASYSLLDAKHLAGDNAGFRVESLPRHMASAWVVYRVPSELFRGLSIGGGVRYASETWGGATKDDPVEISTPGYTLVDAMLAYKTGSWRASLNVTNLADKRHLATCLNRGDCFLGTGRQVNVQMKYLF